MEGGPVGPDVTEPLALLVLDHADPVGQHAAIQNATSTLEHLHAQPEPSLGGRRGDRSIWGRRVWSHWSSRFFNHRGLHDIVMVL